MYATISVSSIFIFRPQNREETMGSFSTFVVISVFQPIAVPCHVGPDSSKISSGALKESEEVVRNSNDEKSDDSLVVAS